MSHSDPNKPPRPSIWSGAPYGTYKGPRGSASQWRAAFQETLNMDPDEAERIVGDDTPWGILSEMAGVMLSADADMGEIKRVYRICAKKYHPDQNKGNEQWAGEQFKRAHAAYVKLGGKA